jgi:hypothetical protein
MRPLSSAHELLKYEPSDNSIMGKLVVLLALLALQLYSTGTPLHTPTCKWIFYANLGYALALEGIAGRRGVETLGGCTSSVSIRYDRRDVCGV